MPTGPRFCPAIISAKERLAEGREKLKAQHQEGSPGVQVCARLTDLIDTVVLDLYESALADIGDTDPQGIQSEIALVPHGGYGRRDIAPYSDIDLMLLHKPTAGDRVKKLARQLSQNIYDTQLHLGFSCATPREACADAFRDPTVFTSLAESRFLGGSVTLFSNFMSSFRRGAKRRARGLITTIRESRREERVKYGDTVYLLSPNVKRSRGALREIQLLRWTGFARYGQNEPRNLFRIGVLSHEDRVRLREAREFLLRLRNELHFCAGKAQDVLERSEQVRIAAVYGYEGSEGLLPVEEFMRDYFAITSDVRYITSHFANAARFKSSLATAFSPLLSIQIEGDFRVGPFSIGATRRGLKRVCGDLEQVLRLMDLANLHDKPIADETWQAIRNSMINLDNVMLTSKATERFLSLLSQPAQLGQMLRRLHELRVLEKIIPAVKRARCLLQFNAYHKYTVDEHSIRAIERAIEFYDDKGPLGESYREMKPNQKKLVHLALLLHDLGKGFEEDHSEVGMRIAADTCKLLGLPEQETETVKFLVHKHLLMNHLALRRDIDDQSVVLQFAHDVGTPDVLKMLYVISCADLAAVGPGVLNLWKLNLLTELYRRTMGHLAGSGPTLGSDEWLKQRRAEVRATVPNLNDDADWNTLIDQLPVSYLAGSGPERIVEELDVLRQLPKNDAIAWGKYQPRRNAVQYTIGTHEEITPGVFHKLTGLLTSKGQQILAADINTLPGNLILDRFYVNDLDFAGEPSRERMEEICDALTDELKHPRDGSPKFRETWSSSDTAATINPAPAKVKIDNNTAENATIIDVFAHDRIGLLYTITRALFELGLSVQVAKIGTYLDQVVDVFYVTDQEGRKIEDENRIEEIRECLLGAIQRPEAEAHELPNR